MWADSVWHNSQQETYILNEDEMIAEVITKNWIIPDSSWGYTNYTLQGKLISSGILKAGTYVLMVKNQSQVIIKN